MKISNHPIRSVIYLVLFLLFSCKKMIDVDLPKNQLVTGSVFLDSSNAVGAVSGIYAEMMNTSTQLSFGNGSITVYTGLAADELFPTSLSNPAEIEFYANSITPENGTVNSLWFQGYKLIYQANACIEGLGHSTGVSTALKNQLTGECKFLRSYIYFNLVNLFGAIPYVTDLNYTLNALLPRQGKDSLMKHLIADLKDAKQLVSLAYPSPEKVRVNKMTVAALLARIYLYEGRWNEAEEAATEIISSGNYMLEPLLNNVFLAASREAIWQLRPVQPSFNTAEGQILNPTSSASTRPRYAISNFLLNAFESGDLRKVNGNWIRTKVVAGQTFYYPYKYKLRSDVNPNPSEYYMVFRVGEQFLIRSEARAQQDKLTEALSDLNRIRSRAGLANLLTATKQEVLSSIENERQRELFAECGQRWYDLKRLHRADAVLGVEKPAGWQVTDQLFPIPFVELQRNPFLVQNAGY